MNLSELPVTGYLDRFSRRPGETLTAYVSQRTPGPCRARLVRVICADPNPAGPGMRMDDLASVFDHHFQARRQDIHQGSYGITAPLPPRPGNAPCTWTLLVHTAAPNLPATLLAEEAGATSIRLRLTPTGAAASLAWSGGSLDLAIGTPLLPRVWYRLTLSADPLTGQVRLTQAPLNGAPLTAEATSPTLHLPGGGIVLLAAENASRPTAHFTGKLEAPAIHAGLDPSAPIIAAWDFTDGIGTQIATDRGPHARHARLVNLPGRAMVGSTWSGREMCWRHAPEDYGAIHFHADDLDDCRWDPDFTFTVPPDLPSAAYAFHLTSGEKSGNEGGEDWLPFYVLPPRAGPHRKVAFLASTFTYQVYANHARGNADAAYKARVAEWDAYPNNPDDFPLYSHSTYNRHPDGSGISISSRRRPILTMRPGFLTFCEDGGNAPPGSGLRHYPADTHLIAWLDAKGIDADIITDEDLDDEGPSLLTPYTAVLTGSHPEYHTPRTLDALQHYVDHGGHFAYLGGNGFYWRVARVPELPHIIELRRAEGGIRAWDAEPGEYYHQLDGGYGGLWRRNRRPPQMLAGVGFSGQGKFEGTHYRRLPASFAPAFTWMFEGIEGGLIGDYGLSGGGAAGFELDRADFALGTPPQTTILARSEDPPASFVTVPEELLSHLATVTGEPPDELKRGEIIWFDTPSGGSVFAVGSITFCGSLWHPGLGGFTGDVSRLLENVLRRFLEDPS